jgi:hypothetical protein
MEREMRIFRFAKSVLLALAFLPAAGAFAANKGSMHISSPEDLAGQTLDVGDYTVRWEGEGPDVELKVMQGKKLIATAAAHKLALPSPSAENGVEIDTDDGNHKLALIFFSGNPVAFQILGPSQAVQVSSK